MDDQRRAKRVKRQPQESPPVKSGNVIVDMAVMNEYFTRLRGMGLTTKQIMQMVLLDPRAIIQDDR